MKRKIAAVLPSFSGGGAERVLINLLNGLDPARYEASLVVFDRQGPLGGALSPDLKVTNLNRPRLRHALPALVTTLRDRRSDVVFSTLGYVNLALLAARHLLPGRLVIREANLPSLALPAARYGAIKQLGYRYLYPHASRVIASSRIMAEELRGFGVPEERLDVLANPVDLLALRMKAAKPKRIPGAGLRLVAAGRLVPQKGFDRLLPLLANFPNVQVVILGDGPQKEDLLSLAAAHGVELVLPGFSDAAPAWFAGADAVVLPSRWEGMPNVALEALACGTPVIATPESGGISELATVCAPEAITVASMTDDFAAALSQLRPRIDMELRPALLPMEYEANTVTEKFSQVLDSVMIGERG